MNKLVLTFLVLLMLFVTGCSQETGVGQAAPSTLDQIKERKKLIIGTSPGYPPFEMRDKERNFVGYDIDLGKAIAESLKVDVEFKEFEFSGLIPALQTGDIDMVISGVTIRGDRALSVSFSNPYYTSGQVLMIQKGDKATKSWKDLDQPGKKIGVSQGTTGALLAKQLYKQAEVLDFDGFTSASIALKGGQIDGVVFDEPGIRMYEVMNADSVKGVYELISNENLGIAVRLNDFAMVNWINSFLYSYRGGAAEQASFAKWFQSNDWINTVEQTNG
ncbi:transporter substrate-binding domain-containing protein [Brevibacillus fulvus]|uniref:Polar amino acid transport system substrate-binding protein n=1 Tax=Brevibacillus fulvus TaxID=1125967 RepID=A0A939BQX0_9BACL|nr:transporter substrate-binding domain-containing protein [Brevibacillus fulvus]MBM7588977.1 polar amino acid transport system substrate-binding protein [Brevibacillus fulvus]